jgi:hypothetical protein
MINLFCFDFEKRLEKKSAIEQVKDVYLCCKNAKLAPREKFGASSKCRVLQNVNINEPHPNGTLPILMLHLVLAIT